MGKILTAGETAKLLRVSVETLQRVLRSGQLPANKVGGRWRISEDDLREYLRGPFGQLSPALRAEPSAYTLQGKPRQRREPLVPRPRGRRGPYKKTRERRAQAAAAGATSSEPAIE